MFIHCFVFRNTFMTLLVDHRPKKIIQLIFLLLFRFAMRSTEVHLLPSPDLVVVVCPEIVSIRLLDTCSLCVVVFDNSIILCAHCSVTTHAVFLAFGKQTIAKAVIVFIFQYSFITVQRTKNYCWLLLFLNALYFNSFENINIVTVH